MRVKADPEDVERGLAQLVLTLIELLRQLVERQAIRQVAAGELGGAAACAGAGCLAFRTALAFAAGAAGEPPRASSCLANS